MDALTIKSENTITTGDIKLFLCDICNDCYSLERSFKLHYRAHKNFTCEVCNQIFTMKGDLTIHLRTHHNETKQTYICAECDAEFLSKNQVQKHMKSHEGKRYVCKICKAVFSDIKEMRKHKMTHKTHVCGDCRASFRYKHELKKHVCAATAQEFKRSDAPIDYLKHPVVKREIISDEAVSKSDSESREEKLHSSGIAASSVKRDIGHSTSGKPYYCEMCGKGFRRNSTLVSHKCAIKKKRIKKAKVKKEN